MTTFLSPTAPTAHANPPAAQHVPLLWSELTVRRNALGVHTEILVELLGAQWRDYTQQENGKLRVSASLVEELIEMEAFIDNVTQELIESAVPDENDVTTLRALVDPEAFKSVFPDARTRHSDIAYPKSFHDAAVGRAAAALTRAGHTVEAYCGDRRFDLTARRTAVAFTKSEAGPFFGTKEKKYFRIERDVYGQPPGLIDEYQAFDDFIESMAAGFEVTETDGFSIIWMPDDRDEFEQQHPDAHTRSVIEGRAPRRYPLRFVRVAAGRRAGMLEAEGKTVRIVSTAPNPARPSQPGKDYVFYGKQEIREELD